MEQIPKPIALHYKAENDTTGTLIAVDANGREFEGNKILAISKYGVSRCLDVNPGTGFVLNGQGQVQITGDRHD